jgi:hypothetical protein
MLFDWTVIYRIRLSGIQKLTRLRSRWDPVLQLWKRIKFQATLIRSLQVLVYSEISLWMLVLSLLIKNHLELLHKIRYTKLSINGKIDRFLQWIPKYFHHFRQLNNQTYSLRGQGNINKKPNKAALVSMKVPIQQRKEEQDAKHLMINLSPTEILIMCQ